MLLIILGMSCNRVLFVDAEPVTTAPDLRTLYLPIWWPTHSSTTHYPSHADLHQAPCFVVLDGDGSPVLTVVLAPVLCDVAHCKHVLRRSSCSFSDTVVMHALNILGVKSIRGLGTHQTRQKTQ
jgi:hypothetical protein